MARVYTNTSPSASGVTYRGFIDRAVMTNNDTTCSYQLDFGVLASSAVNVDYAITAGATGYSNKSGWTDTSYSDGYKENYVYWNGTGQQTGWLVTYTKQHTNINKTFSMSVHSTSGVSSWRTTTLTASVTVTIPAKTSYAVTYNVNGGTGSASNQTKWYGENLTLSDGTGITRNHYTLKGWNTKADGTGTHYNLGATYTGNAALSLYAEWELNAIVVKTKVDGTWKEGIINAKVNGAWVIPHAGYVKVNGVWKEIT